MPGLLAVWGVAVIAPSLLRSTAGTRARWRPDYPVRGYETTQREVRATGSPAIDGGEGAFPGRKQERGNGKKYGGGAAAQPDADGGTARRGAAA